MIELIMIAVVLIVYIAAAVVGLNSTHDLRLSTAFMVLILVAICILSGGIGGTIVAFMAVNNG